jgi:hypothetical protein
VAIGKPSATRVPANELGLSVQKFPFREVTPYGFKGALTAQQEAGMAFRDVLARDIRDVRSITGSQYNEGLGDLVDYYRTNFPDLMQK